MQELKNRIKQLGHNITQLERALEKEKLELEEAKKKAKYSPNWQPSEDNQEYFINNGDEVLRLPYFDDVDDRKTLKNSFAFPTREQAQKYSEWHQAFVELVRLIAEVNEIYEPRVYNYSFTLSSEGKVDYGISYTVIPMLRVKSKNGAQKLIENHADLIKKVWTMPW